MQHAHERGMVHRDIKPQNLIATASSVAANPTHCHVKILDFGLASLRDAPELSDAAQEATGRSEQLGGQQAPSEESPPLMSHELTKTGIMLGTAEYVAPEQIRSPRDADIRADVYSLGCTLYFMLTGRVPFQGESVAAKLVAHMESSAIPPTKLRADLPSALAHIIDRMMAKDPADRFQNPNEVVDALRPFGPDRSVVGSRRSVRRWLVGAAVIAILSIYVVQKLVQPRSGMATLAAITRLFSIEPIRLRGHTDLVSALAISRDGRLALTGSERDGKLLLWNTATGEAIGDPMVHPGWVRSIAFSPDSQRAVVGCSDGFAHLWDLSTQKGIRTFGPHADFVMAVAYSPNGRMIATGGGTVFTRKTGCAAQTRGFISGTWKREPNSARSPRSTPMVSPALSFYPIAA